MGNIDVQIVVQLWQVVFALMSGIVFLIGGTVAAVTFFVRKSECNCANGDLKTLFEIVRKIEADISFLKGKYEK